MAQCVCAEVMSATIHHQVFGKTGLRPGPGKLLIDPSQVSSFRPIRRKHPSSGLAGTAIGLFFAISGANNLFVAGGTKPVYETLVQANVPFPHQTAYFVAGVEFVGGSLVTMGFLSYPACVALLIDMTVATLTSAISTLPKGLSPLNWLDDFFVSVRF